MDSVLSADHAAPFLHLTNRVFERRRIVKNLSFSSVVQFQCGLSGQPGLVLQVPTPSAHDHKYDCAHRRGAIRQAHGPEQSRRAENAEGCPFFWLSGDPASLQLCRGREAGKPKSLFPIGNGLP